VGTETLKDSSRLFAGAAASIVLSTVWELFPNHMSYAITPSPLAFVEHYHWGLASLVVAKHSAGEKQLFQGFGIGMIAIESASENPFGVGKPPEQVVPSIALGVALVWLLVL